MILPEFPFGFFPSNLHGIPSLGFPSEISSKTPLRIFAMISQGVSSGIPPGTPGTSPRIPPDFSWMILPYFFPKFP